MAKKPKVTQAMIQAIFDFWNSQEGSVHHRVLTTDRAKAIRKRLEEGFTVADIKGWIEAWSIIWKGEEYWYTYKWKDIEDFMKRGYKKFLAEKEPYQTYLISNSPQGEAGGFLPSPSASSSYASFQERFAQWMQASEEEKQALKQKWLKG